MTIGGFLANEYKDDNRGFDDFAEYCKQYEHEIYKCGVCGNHYWKTKETEHINKYHRG